MRLAPDELARRIKPSFEARILAPTTILASVTRGLRSPRAAEAAGEAPRRFRAHGIFFFVDSVEFVPRQSTNICACRA